MADAIMTRIRLASLSRTAHHGTGGGANPFIEAAGQGEVDL